MPLAGELGSLYSLKSNRAKSGCWKMASKSWSSASVIASRPLLFGLGLVAAIRVSTWLLMENW